MRSPSEEPGVGACGPNHRVAFAGVKFDIIRPTQAIEWLHKRRREDPFAYLVTPNADHIVRLYEFPEWSEMQRAYEEADLCLCDSQVASRLARLRGIELPVVPGSELVEALFRLGALAGRRIALVGGTSVSINRLQKIVDGAEIIQHIPPMGLISNEDAMRECVDFIEQTAADLILLCVGSPQQELIARRVAAAGRTGGTALCVGAAVEFLTENYIARRVGCAQWPLNGFID